MKRISSKPGAIPILSRPKKPPMFDKSNPTASTHVLACALVIAWRIVYVHDNLVKVSFITLV